MIEYTVSCEDAPKENAGFSENPVFMLLIEHLLFSYQQNLFNYVNNAVYRVPSAAPAREAD